MTITATDVKLQQPERLTDNADGGGQMTGNEIVDGQVNNLFPNISRLDRTTGRVNLRKAFLHVDTANVDVLLGSHVIITAPPADPHVHLTLFDTGSPADNSDERSDAASFVEKYVVKGPIGEYRLWDTQVSGQRAILTFADQDVPGPVVGTVYCLSVEASGYPAHEQYVRVTSVDAGTRQVTDPSGKIVTRNLYTLGINVPLDQDYPGEDISTFATLASAKTKFRTTTVADAARYYGITNLTTAVAPGDKVLQVGSVYGQLVPSTTEETPLLDQPPAGSRLTVIAAGPAQSVTIDYAQGGDTHYLGSPIAPGSLSIVLEGVTYTDANGNIQSAQSSLWSGTVDYANGQIYLARSTGGGTTSAAITWQPAGVAQQAPYTKLTAVSEGTRFYNYDFTLLPAPAPNTITVSYRALGRWYTLIDDGRGNLTGLIPNTGSGTVHYDTGNMVATLGALPDVGTSVLVAWGQVESYTAQPGNITLIKPVISGSTTGGESIKPGTLAIAWNYGTALTATESGSGTITGDADGLVEYAGGTFKFSPNSLPAPGTTYTVTYQTGAITPQLITTTRTSGTLSGTLTSAPVNPGSVQMTVRLIAGTVSGSNYFFGTGTTLPPQPSEQVIHDDGNGHFVNPFDGSAWGTIDYSTGAFSLPTIPHGTPSFAVGDAVSFGHTNVDQIPNSVSSVIWADSTTPFNSDTQTITQDALTIDLTPYIDDQVIGGSVRFSFNGDTIVDRSGSLYRNPSSTDNSAELCGSFDYTSGLATLTQYRTGSGSISLQGLLTRLGDNAGVDVLFRTNGSPLATGSLILNGSFLDGGTISVTGDVNGNIVATDIVGTVDTNTGIVSVRFGSTSGGTFTPRPILYDALRYNAVILGYLPLDAATLGLDPTRLPEDGRVPIFRNGDVVVIHNTKTETLPAPLAAGQQVTLSRQPISKLTIYDDSAIPLVVDPALYTADLTTGVITFADPLDLSAYQQPLAAEHRIEDMRVVTDVQIQGQLTFSAGMAFNYDTDTKISSALLFGDLGGVVQNVFTQKTWTNVFSDTRIGDDSIAKYNDVVYPIVVVNANAITERWSIIFTDSNGAFEVLGEVSGIIATGTISSDTAPINPQTGQPYFTIPSGGWGTGWVANNVLRFNTVGAAHAMWIARSIEAGSATETNDQGRIEGRGDAN